jgi:hypothetical protein
MSADRPEPSEDRAPDTERGTLDRLIPELLKKVIETGTKNLSSETIRQVVSDLKLPREAIHYTFSQLDETKNVVYRALSKEVHDLLARTNIAEELAKALSLLSLEVKMEVRFKPTATADVKTRVKRVSESPDDSNRSNEK